MKMSNPLILFLLRIGLIRLKEVQITEDDIDRDLKRIEQKTKKLSKKEEFERADYSRDPIQAPRHYVEYDNTDDYTRMVSIGIIMVGVIIGAVLLVSFTNVLGVERGESEMSKFRKDTMIKIQNMPCNELKILAETPWGNSEKYDTPIMFAKWEYENNERSFPSPRQDECMIELGWLKETVTKCSKSGRSWCQDQDYVFPRSNGEIKFPSNWFYVDATGKKWEDPNNFLIEFYPDLAKNWKGVK